MFLQNKHCIMRPKSHKSIFSTIFSTKVILCVFVVCIDMFVLIWRSNYDPKFQKAITC